MSYVTVKPGDTLNIGNSSIHFAKKGGNFKAAVHAKPYLRISRVDAKGRTRPIAPGTHAFADMLVSDEYCETLETLQERVHQYDLNFREGMRLAVLEWLKTHPELKRSI